MHQNVLTNEWKEFQMTENNLILRKKDRNNGTNKEQKKNKKKNCIMICMI